MTVTYDCYFNAMVLRDQFYRDWEFFLPGVSWGQGESNVKKYFLLQIFVPRSYTRGDTSVQYYWEVRMKKLFGSTLVLGALSLSFGIGTIYGSVVATTVSYAMLDCPWVMRKILRDAAIRRLRLIVIGALIAGIATWYLLQWLLYNQVQVDILNLWIVDKAQGPGIIAVTC